MLSATSVWPKDFMMINKKLLGILLLLIANGLCGFGQGQLRINEFLASNTSTNVDPDFSAFSDWIELYNAEDFEINLSGYYLSDDLNSPEKYQIPNGIFIPANAYLVFWADDQNMVDLGIHTNFKLNADGEQIGLFDQTGVLSDSIAFGEQATDVSRGRKPGNNEWYFFAQPTPGAYNGTTSYPSLIFSAEPVFSHPGDVYSSPLQLALSTQTSGTIRFTIDGSAPNENSTGYSDPMPINTTTVIRARVFETDKLPGNIITHSFIIDNNVNLPVFSVATNPDFLWGEEIGIYVSSDLERRRNWERPVHVEFFDLPNNSGFVAESNIRLFGNTAYLIPQKSLAVFPDNTINYHLFSKKEITTFESFVLRSSSDDWSSTMFRDAMIQSLVPGHLIIDYQAYRPSIVYLNSQYYGIHNIREKYNKDYLASNHGADPDNIDLLTVSGYSGIYYVLEGDDEHYLAMMDFIENNDMALDENYEYVKSLMYVDDFIDWCIIQNYIKNHSWKHNIKLWRPKTDDGKWKWLLYDTDRGYVTPDDTLIANFYEYEKRFDKLMDNANFSSEFLQRYCSHMNFTFRPERVIGVIDSIAAAIEDEMPNHILRWADSGGVQSMEYWQGQINVMKNFAHLREGFVHEYVDSFFGLNGTASLTVNIDGSEYGTVKAHGIALPYPDSTWVYFKDIPVRLEAIPKLGYDFMGWEGISDENEIFVSLNGDSLITAVFEPQCGFSNIVTEDQYLLAACSPYVIDQDIVINEGATLYAEPGVEIRMGNNLGINVYGQMDFSGSQDSPVKISSQNGTTYWKGITGEGAKISLDFVELTDVYKAIKSEGCETHLMNCTIQESAFSVYDIITVHGGMVSIDNCWIYGSPEAGGSARDAIDCDTVILAYITNNSIFNIADDAIDVGTGSLFVSIENNYIENCQSMGISVGESSIAEIKRNIVTDCKGGIQVHTGATGYIENNTLYSNLTSLRCYHYDNQPTSGGFAYVSNTIFSNSIEEVFQLVENSVLAVSYSISDTDTLPGADNLFANPGFTNPSENDFSLLDGSPCINSGDPSSPVDPDGTRADIGALFYDHYNNICLPENETVMIFPNPASNIVNVELKNSVSILKLEVYNISGNKVMVFENINSNRKTINCNSLAKGLYVLHINATNGISFKRKLVIL